MDLRQRRTLPDVFTNTSGRWPTFQTERLLFDSPPRQHSAGSLSAKTDRFKVVLLGDSNVGKTSLLLRLTRRKFYEANESTLGSTAFSAYEVTVNDSTVKLEMWDTAGQERFAILARLYYSAAKAIILLYDITDKKSFIKANDYWLDEIKQYFAGKKDKPIVYLVGNKQDLEDQRVVQSDVEKIIANESELQIHFYETSAKSGTNVEKLFYDIAEKLFLEGQKKKEDDEKIAINVIAKQKVKSRCCC